MKSLTAITSKRGRTFIALALLALWTHPGSAETPKPDFERDVAPILESRCLRCHNRAQAKGDLVLERRATALASEGVLVPGDPAASGLLDMVSGPEPEMPPKGEHLTAQQVEILRRWIAEGAPWPEARVLADKPVRDLNWWSLRPLAVQQPPREASAVEVHPIDAFVHAKLVERKLTPSPATDRLTLIRRVTFDLTGLPPTPEEIDAFLADVRPAAYDRLVDRLLASPHYGEHWARHWLDVARFSESQGFERDKMRSHAWHYRDYVIDAFNADEPYDRFVREQIAGDVIEPITHAGIVATGFLVAGPWDEVGTTQKSQVMRSRVREEELEDIISAVGQTFLGVTINCARCHAHKFDPISQEDYYAFKAVFEGVRHGDRPLLTPAEFVDWERQHPPPPAKDEQGDKQKEKADDKKNSDKNSDKEPARPQPPLVYAANPQQPSPTYLLARGDVLSKKEVAAPRGLSAVSRPSPDLGLAPDAPEAERRRRFANWLTDPRHPLLARVMVNRVWHYHFGRGLVETPNDLGASGGRPSHPELLDWLASEFIRSGWSVKHLHRQILNTATYRQASASVAAAASVDAENRLLWRFTPRRLEAESVRDAMLAASGEINWKMGGPGFQPFDVVIANSHFYPFRDKLGPEFNRRTIYRTGIQSLRMPLLDTLDCPDLATKTPVRGETTTPIQALALMNDSFVLRQCDALARRVEHEASDSLAAQIRRAYRLTLGREPSAAEARRAEKLADEHGLAQVCWVLFNSSEFIYLR
jgi:hypothetical protein